MSVNIQQLEAIRDDTLAQIESLLATAGPTITVGGVETAWAPLLGHLRLMVDWCDGKLAEYQPFEVQSQATT
jgi:hypothetical protein